MPLSNGDAGRRVRTHFTLDVPGATVAVQFRLEGGIGAAHDPGIDVAQRPERQAELRAQSAEVQRQIVIRDLYLQFASARQQATTAAERVDNARRAVDDAERNLAISISRYRAGEGTITEVTDAQTTLANQRLTLQQALFDYQVARAHLLEAVGQ